VKVTRAVEAARAPRREFALEVGLHVEQREAEFLRLEDDLVATGSRRAIDEPVRDLRLLGNRLDGTLEDVALSGA
jgi:hypothetical protein